jgi:hypothetical protein
MRRNCSSMLTLSSDSTGCSARIPSVGRLYTRFLPFRLVELETATRPFYVMEKSQNRQAAWSGVVGSGRCRILGRGGYLLENLLCGVAGSGRRIGRARRLQVEREVAELNQLRGG